jgi:hypothetical protein
VRTFMPPLYGEKMNKKLMTAINIARREDARGGAGIPPSWFGS